MNDTAIDGLMQRGRAGRGWIIFFTSLYLVTITMFSVSYFKLAAAFESRQRFIVFGGPEDIIVSAEKDFESAKAFHIGQAELTAQTMFNRGPAALDSAARLKRLLDKPNFKRFQGIVKAETPEFIAKNLRQKVEISEFKIIKLLDQSVRIVVYGQLIRTGDFEDQLISEALDLKLTLEFIPNPSFIENGRFPTAVREFEIHTQPIPAQ